MRVVPMTIRWPLGLVAVVALLVAACGADWLQFRGAGSNSATSGQQPPTEWSESKNIAWKVDLPGRGPSSPIVVGDRVVVTCSSGVKQDRLHVLCFDARGGKRLWERQFWATGRTLSHPDSANAAPTPASDGQLVFAFFSSNDLLCLDLDGNLKWLRGLAYDFPAAGNDVGMSSSPLVVGDAVIVQVECQGESFATGVDTATGETQWRVARPREAAWSSPALLHGPAADLVLLQSPSQLTAHDPRSGEQKWIHQVACDGISSALAVDGIVYVPSKGMTALRPGATAEPEVVWNAPSLLPGAASPLAADGRLFLINRSGVLVCASLADGQALWRLRLQGEFWGTPVLVGNRLFCLNKDGNGQVVQVSEDGRRGEIIGGGKLDGPIQCSPAVADGAIFIRSDRHLWKIAAP